MRLHVAFHPSLLPTGAVTPAPLNRPQIFVVIDVLRASTSLVTLVERRAGPIYIAASVEQARAALAVHPGACLVGESGGLAPEGFGFGNSPVELSTAEVGGRPVLFATTNGTAAIRAVHHLGPVLIGAMRNGAALIDQVWEALRRSPADVTIVCAGREGGFGLDDAHCAGYLAARLLDPGRGGLITRHGPVELTDGAEAAVRLYGAAPDTLDVFTRAAAGQNVIRLGLEPDVAYCAQRDASTVVPMLGRELRLLEETAAPGRRL